MKDVLEISKRVAVLPHIHTDPVIPAGYTDEQAQDAVGAMVDSTLVYTDGTPLLSRAALTGDVTASAGSNATTIADDAVTFAKMQNVTGPGYVGRETATSGDLSFLTLTGGGTVPGIDYNEATMFRRRILYVYPTGTSFSSIGGTMVGSSSFTSEEPTGTATYYDAHSRYEIGATTLNSTATLLQTFASEWHGGTSARIGGYRFAACVGKGEAPTATHNAFVGFALDADTLNIFSVQPSSKTNIVAFAFDRADANWQFMHNDSSSTATKVDLGASFAVASKEVLVFEFSRLPDTDVINYKATNLTSGATTSGSVNSNIPAKTTFQRVALASSTTTASSHRLGMIWVYVCNLPTY